MHQLHCHSEYSVRDGMIRVPELCDKAKSLDMSAVTLTEHGNMSSSFELYSECKKAGLKFIAGVEAYIVQDINVKKPKERKQHISLIAKSAIGYRNLLELMSVGGTDGFYHTSRIDVNLLEKYHEGVICMSACFPSSALFLWDDDKDWAYRMARKYKMIFGDDFYIEIMPHKLDIEFKISGVKMNQKEYNLMAVNIAEAQGIKVVATQDSHYLDPSDSEYHDVLMRMQGREPYGVETLYFPSLDESLAMFKEHSYLMRNVVHDAIDMTDRIADSVEDYRIDTDSFQYPKFEVTQELIDSLKK